MKFKYICSLIIVSIFFIGCKEEVLPKPKAKLRLEYALGGTKKVGTKNFEFAYNDKAQIEKKKESSFVISYPEMKGAIFISYKKVNNNLKKLIADAERLSYEHAVKADGIHPQVFSNPDSNVHGVLFEVVGNAASQSQFFATDSTQHFVTGSLYFYTKPNYDSIYPAASYLKEDIGKIMETLKWKN
ncbi:gliding motility lipoprotein GldD [uncultured Maribacter sp.]|uniref:gliding motility lipoprotein GldD n=1 Tax=uncultured Maribacter sp. TaxID=431308 RepID=UPI0026390173|nr:gliding motility lipoprotein GldD [uncultured Maribacter sp.]